MKTLFISAFLCLAASAFAQDSLTTTKSDSVDLYYGARIYDTRIGRSASADPLATQQNNPYQFEQKNTASDSTTVKQPADKPKLIKQ